MVQKAFVCHSPPRIPEFVISLPHAILRQAWPSISSARRRAQRRVDEQGKKVNTTCCESHPVDIQGAQRSLR